MDCKFALINGQLHCTNECGQPDYPRIDRKTGKPKWEVSDDPADWPRRNCIKHVKGPGDHLHDMIRFWTRAEPEQGCGCDELIAKMNAWGSACREHADEIVAHMMEEAKKRGWKSASMPGAATVAKSLVYWSVRRWERATASRPDS